MKLNGALEAIINNNPMTEVAFWTSHESHSVVDICEGHWSQFKKMVYVSTEHSFIPFSETVDMCERLRVFFFSSRSNLTSSTFLSLKYGKIPPSATCSSLQPHIIQPAFSHQPVSLKPSFSSLQLCLSLPSLCVSLLYLQWKVFLCINKENFSLLVIRLW